MQSLKNSRKTPRVQKFLYFMSGHFPIGAGFFKPWVAEMTHPLSRAQNLMTHPPSALDHSPPLYFLTTPLMTALPLTKPYLITLTITQVLSMFHKSWDYIVHNWILGTHSPESIKDTLMTHRGGLGLIPVCVHCRPIFCYGNVMSVIVLCVREGTNNWNRNEGLGAQLT